MQHNSCARCKHEATGRKILATSSGERASFLGTRCDTCFTWNYPEMKRKLWEEKSSPIHYSCQDCTLQTHDEMDEFMLTQYKSDSFSSGSVCRKCVDWTEKCPVRKNFLLWEKEEEQKV